MMQNKVRIFQTNEVLLNDTNQLELVQSAASCWCTAHRLVVIIGSFLPSNISNSLKYL